MVGILVVYRKPTAKFKKIPTTIELGAFAHCATPIYETQNISGELDHLVEAFQTDDYLGAEIK